MIPTGEAGTQEASFTPTCVHRKVHIAPVLSNLSLRSGLVGERPEVEVVLDLLPAVGQPLRLIQEEQDDGQAEGGLLDIQESLLERGKAIAQGNDGKLQALQDQGDEHGAEDRPVQAPRATDEDNPHDPEGPAKLEMLRAHSEDGR